MRFYSGEGNASAIWRPHGVLVRIIWAVQEPDHTSAVGVHEINVPEMLIAVTVAGEENASAVGRPPRLDIFVTGGVGELLQVIGRDDKGVAPKSVADGKAEVKSLSEPGTMRNTRPPRHPLEGRVS